MTDTVALNVKLSADGSALIAEVKDVERAFTSLGSTLDKNKAKQKDSAQTLVEWGEKAKKVVEAVAIEEAIRRTGEWFTEFIKHGIEANDMLAKQSRQLGISAQSFATLEAAAKLAGVSTGEVETGTRRLARGIAEAVEKSGEMRDAFKQLHLNAKALLELPLDQQFIKVSDAMNNVGNSAVKTQLAMQIFGRGGAALINLMDEVGKHFKEDSELIQVAYGGSLQDIAEKSEKAKDAMERLGILSDGFQRALSARVAPVIRMAADRLLDMAKAAGGMGPIVEKVFQRIVAAAADALNGIQSLMRGFEFLSVGLQTAWNAIERAYLWFKKSTTDSVEGLTEKMREAQAELAQFTKNNPQAMDSRYGQALQQRIAGIQAEIDVAKSRNDIEGEYQQSISVLDKNLSDLRVKLDALVAPTTKWGDALQRTIKISDDLDAAIESNKAAFGDLSDAAKDATRAAEQAAAARKAVFDAQQKEQDKQDQKEWEQWNETRQKHLKDALKVADDYRKQLEKNEAAAAKQMQDLWTHALQNVGDVWAKAWSGAFDSFKSFKDAMISGFKQMMGELLHIAITQPITVAIQAQVTGQGGGLTGVSAGGSNAGVIASAVGGGGSGGSFVGQAASSVGMASKLLTALRGGASSVFGSLNSSILNSASGVVNTLNSMGMTTVAQSFINVIDSFSALGNQIGSFFGVQGGGAALGGLATAGAGFAGGWIGNKLAGVISNRQPNDNGLLSAGGGIAGAYAGAQYGSYGGPIGAAIGAAVGAVVATLAGTDVKGQRVALGVNVGDQATQQGSTPLITTASGLRLSGSGRRTSPQDAQTMLDAFSQIDANLTSAARAAGLLVDFTGKTLTNPAQAGRNVPQTFFGSIAKGQVNKQDVEEAAANFIQAWIGALGDQVSTRVRTLVGATNGTADQLAEAFVSALRIDKLLNVNAFKDVNTALDALGQASGTLADQYQRATTMVLKLSRAYDGSAESLTSLSDALASQKNLAVELALAYKATAEQIHSSFATTIDSIQESVMSAEDIYAKRRQQIDDLMAMLATAVDPDAIANLVSQIQQLSTSAFGLLDESQKQAMAGEFVNFLQDAQRLANQRIAVGQGSLSNTEDASNASVAANLQAQAAQMAADSAAVQAAASQQFSDAVTQFAALPDQIAAVLAALRAGTFEVSGPFGGLP